MNNDKTMSRKAKRFLGAGASHIIIIFFGVLMIYPVLWLIMSSLKSGNTIFSDPSLIPNPATFAHYVKGWNGVAGVHFSRFFLNSIFLCSLVVIGNAVSCSFAAYAFARLKFKFRGIWFGIMMLSIMLPAHVKTIPQYVMFRTLGWIDSPLYLPLVVPKFLATDAFFVFLLVQFMRSLPRELDEAATIDGCSRAGIFFRIVLPLSVPSLVTTALFSFLWTWDDFFNQLLYISTAERYTVPLALRMFLDATGQSNWGSMLAMSVTSLLPSFVLFFCLQRYFVQGISTTGIKG